LTSTNAEAYQAVQLTDERRHTGRYLSRSLRAFCHFLLNPAYSAAKAGVSNFTRWLAVHMAHEYAPGIRFNALAPGFFLTSQNRYLLPDEQIGELIARGKTIMEHTPTKRFGDPEDLLCTVLWLLSDGASFVTDIVVPVDGGFSAFSGV
jgi:NAD(P)-dependent dehydrogenase (short-subunit alcohol dehydrogenase family)